MEEASLGWSPLSGSGSTSGPAQLEDGSLVGKVPSRSLSRAASVSAFSASISKFASASSARGIGSSGVLGGVSERDMRVFYPRLPNRNGAVASTK